MGRPPVAHRKLKRSELLTELRTLEAALRALASDLSLPGALRYRLIQLANRAQRTADRATR